MAENRIYAYCRVSKNDGTMTIENQTHAIDLWAKEKGVQIATYYKDECKGDTPVEKRQQLPVLLDNLRAGDTVVVVEVFRLHRSASGLEKLYREIIEDKKAEFVTLNEKEKILNTDGMANDDLLQQGMKKIILNVLAMCGELEKRNISIRTKRALKERKDRGVVLGRPKRVMPENFKTLYEKACDKSNSYTHLNAMKDLGLKKTTYYELIKDLKKTCEKQSYTELTYDLYNKPENKNKSLFPNFENPYERLGLNNNNYLFQPQMTKGDK